jgi:preprotein translocase subunit SecF
MLHKFWRIMRIMALFSIVVAALAVILVMQGERELQVHMMIATALGVALSVLLAGALMTLVFLSSRSGHDEQARRVDKEEGL